MQRDVGHKVEKTEDRRGMDGRDMDLFCRAPSSELPRRCRKASCSSGINGEWA